MNIINETVIENLRENTKRLLDVYEDFGLNKTPKNISEDQDSNNQDSNNKE